MATYTLTTSEAADYDSNDDQRIQSLMADLHKRFGHESHKMSGSTEVLHPDGFVIATLSDTE